MNYHLKLIPNLKDLVAKTFEYLPNCQMIEFLVTKKRIKKSFDQNGSTSRSTTSNLSCKVIFFNNSHLTSYSEAISLSLKKTASDRNACSK